MKIEQVLARRSDLSTFLVHLSRDSDGKTAKERLISIIKERCIKLGNPMGHAVGSLSKANLSLDSQRCLCFTETPLEYVSLLLNDIDGRSCHFRPYGIAITKRQGRDNGLNPVWYLDISQGHTWLSSYVNALVDRAVASRAFDQDPIAKLTPFIEQMGRGIGYRKEFWWEREWRSTQHLILPNKILVFCPEGEICEFKKLVEEYEFGPRAQYVDPTWSLEQIIARIAGFNSTEVDLI